MISRLTRPSHDVIIRTASLILMTGLAVDAGAAPSELRLHQPPPAFAEAPCRPRVSRGPRTAPVYRWTDAQGVVHFTDRPADADSSRLALEQGPELQLTVSATGLALGEQLSDRIRAESFQIYKIIRSQFGVPLERSPELKVTLVRDSDALASLLMVDSSQVASLLGVYVGATSSVYVLAQRNDELTLQILRHELAHAVLHELLGQVPIWLNEGMASYFEPMQVAAMGATIPAQPERMRDILSLFRADPEGAFVAQVLGADQRTFYGDRRDVMYSASWGLVSALMSNRDGQLILARLLRELRESNCQPVDSVAFMRRNYPEGLGSLSAMVRRWASAEATDHHY